MNIGRWIKSIRHKIRILYYAARNPRLPLLSKILLGLTLGYALSPIDLIPDFIPLLGYLDDLILLPVLIWLTMRTIPEDIREDAEGEAERSGGQDPGKSRLGGAVIILIWVLLAGYFIRKIVADG